MRNFRSSRTIGALVGAALVTGACAAPYGAVDVSEPSATTTPAALRVTDATRLAGAWRLAGTNSPADGSLVQIGEVIRTWCDVGWMESGYLLGFAGRLRMTHTASSLGEEDGPVVLCPEAETTGWLATVAYVEDLGSELRLVDAAGAVAARLTPEPSPSPPAGVATSIVEYFHHFEMVIAPREQVRASLPAHLHAPTENEVIGIWKVDLPDLLPGVQLDVRSDGTLLNSDGCNYGGEALWSMGEDGRWMTGGAGGTTLMYCEGMYHVPVWDTALVGLDVEGRLILLDADGNELERLVRAR